MKIEFTPIKETTCGLDIHKDMIEACVILNYGADAIMRTFSTMRASLYELRDWLASLNCLNVLMESTSVYWIPIYEILEEAPSMDVGVGNAQKMKNVPGRPKTDKEDAIWISKLCMFGLLLKSFIVGRKFRELREYTRYYKKLVQDKARHIARIEKLLQMNGFKLSSVISDIVGMSGKRMLNVLAERGTITLFQIKELTSNRLKSSPEEIESAINGRLKASSQFLLKKMLKKLAVLEAEISDIVVDMDKMAAPYANEIKLLDSIPGLDRIASISIIAEISNDLSSFETSRRFTSWAGLAPKDSMSAGKLKSSRTKKANQYLKSLLVECAWAATRARDTRLNRWYWSHQGKLGKKKAVIAVARKLLTYVYAILKSGKPYDTSLDTAVSKPIGYESKPETAVVEIGQCINSTPCEKAGINQNGNGASIYSGATVTETLSDSASAQGAASARKKRGRPKKSASADIKQMSCSQPNEDTSGVKMPKRRGRPKKMPIIVQDTDGGQIT